MVAKAPAEEVPTDTPDVDTTDIDATMAAFAKQIAERAMKLPRAQLSLQLDAFKSLTTYKMVLNKAARDDTDDGLGGGIADLRGDIFGQEAQDTGPVAGGPVAIDTGDDNPEDDNG